jgi:hypothetical protein
MPEILDDYRQKLIDRYRTQPQDLGSMMSRFGVESLHKPLEPGGWSAHQVLVHVRDTEAEAFSPRIVAMAEEDDPEFADFDGEAWMAAHYTPAEPVPVILDEILQVRTLALKKIEPLQPEGWNRTGRHPARGRKTIQWWVEYAVAHTDEHLEQLGRG